MRTKIVQKENRVIAQRINKGMTQGKFGELCGVSRPVICLCEKGNPVKIDTAQKIAGALDKEINELFEIVTS